MTQKIPRVSICIATHNSASTIRHTLDAILKQTFQDFEVVLVDDYSEDTTIPLIYTEYCLRDNRFKFHINCTDRNLPYIDAFNKSYQLGTGEYLVRMDHDDVPLPDYLECLVNYMDKHLYLDACCTGVFEYESNSYDKIDFNNLDETKKEYMLNENYTKWASIFNHCPIAVMHLSDYVDRTYVFNNQASCIRRTSYRKYKPTCKFFVMGDVMFWKELMSKGARVEKIEEYKMLYMGKNASANWDIPPYVPQENHYFYEQGIIPFYYHIYYTYKGLFYYDETMKIVEDTTVYELREVMKNTLVAFKDELLRINKYDKIPKFMQI